MKTCSLSAFSSGVSGTMAPWMVRPKGLPAGNNHQDLVWVLLHPQLQSSTLDNRGNGQSQKDNRTEQVKVQHSRLRALSRSSWWIPDPLYTLPSRLAFWKLYRSRLMM